MNCSLSFFPFFSVPAFLEKYVPQDEKPTAYVKIRLFERSEFTDFSKPSVFQVFWKTGLALLVLLGRCQKDGLRPFGYMSLSLYIRLS
jgi:hypothetical protein